MLKARMIVFLLFIVAVASFTTTVRADTYTIESIDDFKDAVQHATNGDTIVFKTIIDFSQLNDFQYWNDNGNGQFYNARVWQINNIALVILEGQGSQGGIINGEITFNNADGSVLNGLTLQHVRVSVIGDSDDVTISENTFNPGTLYIDTGSDNYVIQDNEFFGTSGIYIYQTSGTAEGAVQGNTLNGLPIQYMQGSSCSVDGGDYGEILAVNCDSVQISNIKVPSSSVPRASTFILLSGVSQATLSNIEIDQGNLIYKIEVDKSENVVIKDSRLTNTTIEIRASNNVSVENTVFNLVGLEQIRDTTGIWVSEETKNVWIENNDFTFDGKAISIIHSEGTTIKDNVFRNAGNDTTIYTDNSNETVIKENMFLNTDPDTQHYLGTVGYIEVRANIEGVHGLLVSDNNFTAQPYYNRGTLLRYLRGVMVSGVNDVEVKNNTFNYLVFGLALDKSNNIVIEGNGFSSNYYSIGLGAENGVIIRKNTFNNSRYDLYINNVLHNISIYGNVFDNKKETMHTSIMFEEPVDYDIHAYMNLFMATDRILDCDNHENFVEKNETFSSPGEITYTYNGREYTGIVGNYYAGYSGTDEDGDGVGESPYIVYYWWKNSEKVTMADEHPLVSPDIVYRWIGASAPQHGGGRERQEGGGENILQSIPVEMTLERRELMNKARETAESLREKIMELTKTHPEMLENTETVRNMLEKEGISELMEEMQAENLIGEIIHLPSQGAIQLRQTLEKIYGPLLVNYPEPMGRIYLLYTLYYLQ